MRVSIGTGKAAPRNGRTATGMLTMLLDKNKYETATNKLKYWKDLAWIDAEEKRLTKRICINNRYRPLIVINMQRYECIRDLSIELKKL